MNTGTAILILAAYGVGWIVRTTDKFFGNLTLFIISGAILIAAGAGADNTEIAIAVALTLLTLANLILSVFTAKK